MIAGVAKSSVAQSDMNDAPGVLNANSWGIQFGSPSWKVNNGYTALSSSYTYTTNDVLMIAVDVDAGKFWFGKNGTWIESGNPATGANAIFTNLTGEIMPMLGVYASGNTGSVNFGQRPFAYTAPSGFKALCTQNLPTPAVGASASTQAGKYFNTVLYTGNGSARSITGVGFQPDMVWIKSRSGAYDHNINDAVRGAGKFIYTNLTAAEGNYPTDFASFDTNGFSLGSGTGTATNNNGSTYVAWSWKANGAGVSNTAGSISSTVSANTTAGISVVTYSGNSTAGATIGHGLGAVPKLIIIKPRNRDEGWVVGHSSIGFSKCLFLHSTSAEFTTSAPFNNTAPTSSLITLGNGTGTNGSTYNYVAYCFAEVAGFSKFGSYTGNGSADGVFVYCGFRPRWILVKRTDAGPYNWRLTDTARSTYNQTIGMLEPSSSAAEYTDAGNSDFDILSNGFKVRNTTAGLNGSSGTFIFMAFAEAPFNYSRAR